jgi:hypothetical protein
MDKGRRRTSKWCVALGAAVVLAAAGCGGDDEDPTAADTDLTAVRCPLVATGEQVGGVDELEPAPGAFDTAELVGDRLADAQAQAGDHGCEIVVALEDGAGKPVPTDVDPERIYVYVEDGVVTEIEGVGGGL